MISIPSVYKRLSKREFARSFISLVSRRITPGVQSDRRAALVSLAAIPAVLSAKPAEAAYGDSANVFGRSTNTSGAFRTTSWATVVAPKPRSQPAVDLKLVQFRAESSADCVFAYRFERHESVKS